MVLPAPVKVTNWPPLLMPPLRASVPSLPTLNVVPDPLLLVMPPLTLSEELLATVNVVPPVSASDRLER